MSDRLLQALVVIVGVPAVLVGYVVVIELGLRGLPQPQRARVRPWLWLAPAFVLLGLFLLYPALRTIMLAFYGPDSRQFVGFENFRYVFSDRAMLLALRNSGLWLIFFTAATVSLGLLIAVLADRVRYEPAVKAAIFMPMAISFVAAGVIWRFMYDYRPPGTPQTGAVNALLTAVIPGFEPQAWLINTPWNNAALIIAGVWVWTGFCMVILSAGLKGIPKDILEAARVDGAAEWQTFRHVTLPVLGPTIAVVTTTMLITALKAFDIVYVMTNGNYETDVVANRMYKEMFNVRHFGRASVIAVVLLAAIVPVMLFNLKRFREQEATR